MLKFEESKIIVSVNCPSIFILSRVCYDDKELRMACFIWIEIDFLRCRFYTVTHFMRALEIVGLHEYASGLVYCVDITPSFTSYSTTADFRRKVCRGC